MQQHADNPLSLPMKTGLVIKYIYANVKQDFDVSSSFPFNVHQVDDALVEKIISPQATCINRSDLFKLLKEDGAYFYHDTVRILNPQTKTFICLGKDFRYDFSQIPSTPTSEPTRPVNEIMLWIQGIDKPFKNRIKSLSHRVRRLEKQQQELLKKVDMGSPVAQLPRPLPLHTLDPDIYFNLPASRRSSAMYCVDSRNNLDEGEKQNSFTALPRLSENAETSNTNKQKLGLAIMYAEPLVRREGKNLSTLPDAVDYEEECSKIYETLDQKGLQIDIIIEIATRENLINVLSRNPTILHIICHGEYDNDRNQFYLCFENAEGQMDPMYASDLRAILETLKTRVQLVFVNACHSEQVARVFEDAGVPCVIAVQSQLQIADVVARKFAQVFYDYIFDGFTLGEAFENARLASRSADSLSCCCAHAHKRNCKWYKKAATEGYYKAHLYHDPCCTGCPKAKEHVHKYACKWANEFLQEALQDDEDILDPIRFDAENMEIKTCCCSPDLPHDESMKFLKLLQKNSIGLDKLVLFEEREPGKVVNRKHYNILEQKYPVKRLIGRNKSMHELFKLVKSEEKFVLLYGQSGVGKTALVKQLANYLYARDYFRFKISIIMMEKITSVSYFKSELMKEIDFAYDFKSFCQAVKHKECLFILEKCDGLIERNRHDFVEFLNEIAENTKKVSFILITNQLYQLNLRANAVELGNLSAVDAAKLLLLSTNTDKLSWRIRNIDTLKRSKLFQENQSFSPHAIWWISQRLNQCGDFEKVEKEILEKQISFDTGNSEAISFTLENIKKDNPEGYSFIHLISSFPSGLGWEDLEELCHLKIFRPDWEDILARLLSQDQDAEKPEGEEIEEEVEEEEEEVEEEDEGGEVSIQERKSKINTGNYFWITVARGNNSNLFLKPAQSVYQFIAKNLRNEYPEWQFAKLEYLTLFALTLIERAKTHYFYNEQLIENSLVCEHGIWNFREENSFYKDQIEGEMTSIYLRRMSFDGMKELWTIFQEHETNFLSCLELELIKPLLASPEYKEKTLDLLEILWIAIPTCFKIYSSRIEGTITLVSTIIGRVTELGIANDNITMLKIKLHLLMVAVAVNQKQEAETLFNTLLSEIDLIDKLKLAISNEYWVNGASLATNLTKAFFFYKLSRGKYANAERIHLNEEQKEFNSVERILKYSCETILSKLGPDFDFERAAVGILTCKAKKNANKKNIKDQFESQLKNAVDIFAAHKCKKLELKTRFMIAEFQLL